jgi:hypothetical protein
MEGRDDRGMKKGQGIGVMVVAVVVMKERIE